MGKSAEDLSKFRREEQTPNAEGGLFLKIVGEEGKRFFTKAPEPRPGYRRRAQQVVEFLKQTRLLRMQCSNAGDLQEAYLTQQLKVVSTQLRRMRRQHIREWRAELTAELNQAD
eukprot:101990-Pyramimonas_sp.AAC.1